MFGGDPFGDSMFGGVHQHMRRQMREMDRMMNAMVMDPFGMMGMAGGGMMLPGGGDPRQQMIDDGNGSRRALHQQPSHHHHSQMAMSPFGGFGFPGGLLGGGLLGGFMRQMEDMQDVAMSDPHSHVYSHSTTITFDGNRQPRIYEESLRKAGDVKETRRSMRNGEHGDHLEIGHHIGDRTHVIEKKRDKDGKIREQQRFVNLDQERAEDFDREFTSRVRDNVGSRGRRPTHQAISGAGGNTSTTSGSNAPIITLPDDDDDEDYRLPETRPPRTGGPVIQEVSDDEAERATPKRRRGVFGRMFQANDE